MATKEEDYIRLAAELGKQIKKYRQDRGMSQTELAEAVGVTRDAIWRYEAGKRTPSVPNLYKLSQVLKVSIERDLLKVNIKDYIQRRGEDAGTVLEIFSFPNDTFENQKYIGQLEESCQAKRLIQSFISRIYMTDKVILSLFRKRHFNYLRRELSEEQKQRILDGRDLRRRLRYEDVVYISHEIINEYELERFTLGEPPYDELTPEDRVEQYSYLLEVLDKYSENVFLALTKEFLPIECLILDNERFIIQNIRGYIVISAKEAAVQYISHFKNVWANAECGDSVRKFIEKQIKTIKSKQTDKYK